MLPKLYVNLFFRNRLLGLARGVHKDIGGSATELLTNKTKDWKIGADPGEYGIQRVPSPHHNPRSLQTKHSKGDLFSLCQVPISIPRTTLCVLEGGYICDPLFFSKP